jgi:hypothetical protein
MIEIGYYSIADIRNLILPYIGGEFYETTMYFKGQHFLIRVKPYRFANGVVYLRKISSKTNMNGLMLESVYPRQNSLMAVPLKIFKRHFTHVL